MVEQWRGHMTSWRHALAASLAIAVCAWSPDAAAQPVPQAAAAPTYADLVGLAEVAAVVAEVTVKDQVVIPPERAPGVPSGRVRLYLTTQTVRVLKGPGALGGSVNYLADVPLDIRGRPPKLRKQTFLIFANPVAANPGQLQLVSPQAQLLLTPAIEERTRGVIGQLVGPQIPPRITRVHDVISVAGNLAGESETQMFVDEPEPVH